MEPTNRKSELPLISESAIIKRVVEGEKELYELIIRRNNQLLYRVIRGYLNEEADVEDAMQETYIKAYQNLHKFRGDAAFSTWLVRIGINEALKRIRNLNKEMKIHSNKDLENRLEVEAPSTPERETIQWETKAAIERAVDKLSLKYRTVFIMREVEGMSVAEVAQCLDISAENVKVRLHRAKKMLKEELTDTTLSEYAFSYGSKHCDRMTQTVMDRIQNLSSEKAAKKSTGFLGFLRWKKKN